MQCPICGSDEFLLPPWVWSDLFRIVKLKRRIECYSCYCNFEGNALEVWRWQWYYWNPRLPKVRIRATGALGNSLRALIPAPWTHVKGLLAAPEKEDDGN